MILMVQTRVLTSAVIKPLLLNEHSMLISMITTSFVNYCKEQL